MIAGGAHAEVSVSEATIVDISEILLVKTTK
jgi:hypothetical protein